MNHIHIHHHHRHSRGAAILPRHHRHTSELFHGILTHTAEFVHKNVVMCIALLAAAVTSILVPPDREYLGYFDVKTLTCLFCVLAVVCALKNVNFFYLLARKVVELFKNARMSVLVLVYITFIGSMLIANDMALLTFLPLGYLVLSATGKEKYMAFTFIMQNIAANLGGMLTPFGNPQNLYLYSKYEIPTGEFMAIMLPPFLLSIALITLSCLVFVKAEPLSPEENGGISSAVCALDRDRFPWNSLRSRTDRYSRFFDLYGSQGASHGGLSIASDLCIFLYFCGKYGADRSGALALLDASRKKHVAVQRSFLSGHQ